MYADLWAVLPGNKWMKLFILAVAAALIIALLFEVVFPMLSPLLPGSDAAVGSGVAGVPHGGGVSSTQPTASMIQPR